MRSIYFHLQHRENKPAVLMRLFSRAALSVLAVTTSLMLVSGAQAADERPNIVLLVADDVGFSDFPRFGGEAQTPIMDSFADTGMTLTNFHVLPTCSPSRSAFLSGVDNHLNGMGTMQGQLGNPNNAAQVGNPGYTGYLNRRAITTATLLKDNGYDTYMTGKWHLGEEVDVEGGQTLFPQGWWPIDRGFTRSYGVLEGGGEHFGSCERAEGHCTRFFEDDTIITADIPGDYFSSSSNMDKALEFISADVEANAGERKPFFYYFADTMAHEPNQVPDGFIRDELYEHYLSRGWDGVREDRLAKMQTSGIIPASVALPSRLFNMPEWDNEEDPRWGPLLAEVTTAPYDVIWRIPVGDVAALKRTLAMKMAAYTAMVEYFDLQVARLVQHLKDIGEYDNTVFMYFSDNGGDARPWDIIDQDYMLRRGVDNSLDNIGNRNSFVANGPAWAQASNTPLYGSKITMGQAGIRSPLVIAHPAGNIAPGSMSKTVTTLTDLGATVLSYANVTHPVGTGVAPNWDACTGTYNDLTGICPMTGKDLSPLLSGEVDQVHMDEPLGFELFGVTNKAMFLEGSDKTLWKILRLEFLGYGNVFGWGAPGPANVEPWRLFNLTEDPSESNDLSTSEPEKLATMIAMYKEYESNVDVVSVIPSRTVQLDVGVDSAEVVSLVMPGNTTMHTITVVNTTDAEDTYTASCVSAWPCELSLSGQSVMAASGTVDVTLAAGASALYELAITVPEGAAESDKNVARVNVAAVDAPEGEESLTVVTTAGEKLVITTPAVATDNGNGGGLSMNPLYLLLIFGALLFPRFRKRSRITAA